MNGATSANSSNLLECSRSSTTVYMHREQSKVIADIETTAPLWFANKNKLKHSTSSNNTVVVSDTCSQSCM